MTLRFMFFKQWSRIVIFVIVIMLSWCVSGKSQISKITKDVLDASVRLQWTDPDSAILLLRQAYESPDAVPESKAAVALALSKTFNQRRECDSIAYWNKIAKEWYREVDDSRNLAEVEYQNGYEAFCRMNYEEAMSYILQGLHTMEALEDDGGIALGHLRMARIFHFTAKMEQSAEYGRLAARRFETLRNYPDAWDSWSFAGHGYRMANDSVQAKECFEKGLDMAERSTMPKVLGLAYNDLASFYMEYNLYDSAEIYFQKSIDLVDSADARQIMVIKNGLGQVYLHTGQYQKCIDVLSDAMTVVRNTGELFFMTELPEYIAKSYAGLGQYDSAYKYMELNWRYSDSLFTQDQDQALEEMRSKYESDQKDAVIARQKVERKYGLALFLAVCSMAFMFYRRYISKKKTNAILDEKNREKDFLLKEIHHRVKNNLQILSSLLNLQAEYIKDENAINAITEGRNRVQSMAFIHQQLYSDENVTQVNMKEFLSDLCDHLSDSFAPDQKKLNITQEVQVEFFDIETAIPLGLIVNELITNSIKYAFRKHEKGSIFVKLWINISDQLCLQVSDDGVGEPSADDFGDGSGFGSDLVKMLSQKLRGKITVDSTTGYSTLIVFDRFKSFSKLPSSDDLIAN